MTLPPGMILSPRAATATSLDQRTSSKSLATRHGIGNNVV
jgi:hypothetical protein